MAQEEHILSDSHSGGGGGGGVSSDRSRNVKQKRVPQRGLGVAHLEKIRLEEERKKEALEAANLLGNNAIGSVSDAAAPSPCLAVQCPSLVPSLSPSPPNFQSANSLYISSPSIPIQMNGGVEDTNLQAISTSGNGGWGRLWNNGDYNNRNDFLGAAAFRPQMNLQLESNAAAVAVIPQRFFRFQQPASPVANASSPSAALEPPSNQNVLGNNNFGSSWPEEYKMVGVKRSYPFSLDSPPSRSFAGHFDPSKSRCDELPSCSSGYTPQMEPRNIYMSCSRDGPSNPSPLPEQNQGGVLRDDGRLNGDFLTLAPPASALFAPNSKHKYPIDKLGSYVPEENHGSQVHNLRTSRSREEPFSFFPVRSDVDETSGRVMNANGEKGETIDLNLKL